MLQNLEPCIFCKTRRLDDISSIRTALNKLLTSLNFKNTLGSQEIKLTSVEGLGWPTRTGLKLPEWITDAGEVERCPLKPDQGWSCLEGETPRRGSLVAWCLADRSSLQPEEHRGWRRYSPCGCLWTDTATPLNNLLSLLFG